MWVAPIREIATRLGAGWTLHGTVRDDGGMELRSPPNANHQRSGVVIAPQGAEIHVQMLVAAGASYQDVHASKDPAVILQYIQKTMTETGGYCAVKDTSSPPWNDYLAEMTPFPDVGGGGDGMDGLDDI